MKLQKLVLVSIIATALGACNSNVSIHYPETKKVDSSRVYFGDTVQDPYAWLEDDYSEETMAWVDAQNAVTRAHLDTMSQLAKLKERMPKYWKYEKYGVPKRTAAGLVYSYNDGSMDQPQLLLEKDGETTVLLDPNSFSEDGTASLNNWAVSWDGKHIAYSVSGSGSDWVEIRVKDIETGKTLPDVVKWVKFSGISWDKNGFYYSAFPAPEKEGDTYSAKNEFHQIRYHKLGGDQDILVYDAPAHPQRTHGATVDHDHNYLIVTGANSTSGNSVAVRKLSSKEPFKTWVPEFDHDWRYLGNWNDGFLFLTNYNATNNQIIWINPAKPAKKYWQTLVMEEEYVLQDAVVTPQGIVCNYLKDVVNELVVIHPKTGDRSVVDGPELGNIGGLRYDKEQKQSYFQFQSYTMPGMIYQLDDSLITSPYKKIDLPYNPEDYTTERLFYKSKDGTQIPLFITRKKTTDKAPQTPCFLYGYGGFNISIQPHYKPDRMAFLEAGGIYAVANIRGGSEYGEAWHQAGTQQQKQNVFDDFIAAAEYLQEKGFTSADKLAIHGRSNGGLLAGAVLTQRPDLCAVALPKVGVLDMLKYHEFTIGWAWAADYGRSDDSKAMYEYLKAYSPLHNVKSTEYPATMVITGDHDDRVVPAHSFKFAATLQAHQKGDNPVLLRIDKNAGHGAGKPISMQVDEFADQWAFVMSHLNMRL